MVWKAIVRSKFEAENLKTGEFKKLFGEYFGDPRFWDDLAKTGSGTDEELERLLRRYFSEHDFQGADLEFWKKEIAESDGAQPLA